MVWGGRDCVLPMRMDAASEVRNPEVGFRLPATNNVLSKKWWLEMAGRNATRGSRLEIGSASRRTEEEQDEQ